MARIESIAVAGYYPTPVRVTDLIVSCLQKKEETYVRPTVILDPCAGEGEALRTLVKALTAPGATWSTCAKAVAIEMEASRFAVLKKEFQNGTLAHNDAFLVEVVGRADVLYLNPPYDIDRVHGRLEQRFLDRFRGALGADNLLIFVVPFYALEASAAVLSTEFRNLECFRFPGDEWNAYKQVVLFADKRDEASFMPNDIDHQRVVRWSTDANTIPVLTEGATTRIVTSGTFFNTLKERQIDLLSLTAAARPWMSTSKRGTSERVMGVCPEGDSALAMTRRYELATPPRPAHIAAGLAAGVFNGVVVKPDNDTSLPAIMLKGVFNKEFKTVEERQNKKGETTSVIQVQQPRLITTVLDLVKNQYHTIRNSNEITGVKDLASMTMADLLDKYGRGLMAAMLSQCPVLHDPSSPTNVVVFVPKMTRPLFTAQHEAVQALVKLLGGPGVSLRRRRQEAAFLLGEIGSGKTSTALATAKTIGSQKTLVLCPPHLLDGWAEQIREVVPEAKVVVLSSASDVDAVVGMDGWVIALLSRETAKLGHANAAVIKRCPKCHADLPEKAAEKRLSCESVRRVYPGSLKPIADGLKSMEKGLAVDVKKLVTRAIDANQMTVVADVLAFMADADLIAHAIAHLQATKGIKNYSSEMTEVRGWLMLAADDETMTELARAVLPDDNYQGFRDWVKHHTAAYMANPTASDYVSFGGVSRDYRTKALTLRDIPLRSRNLIARSRHVIRSYSTSSKCGEPLYYAIPEPRRFPLATYIVRHHRKTFDMLLMDEGHEYGTEGSAQEVAAHRLTALQLPTILMTGTIMNGYAESMFTNMWALSRRFRREFGRDDMRLFIDRYGYRRVVTEDRDAKGEVITFGSQSDRVQRSSKNSGRAPGVLPLFLFQHLLPISVTLHKRDMATNIPPCREHAIHILPTAAQEAEFNRLKGALVTAMRKDRYSDTKSGKLLGALASLPAYFDINTTDTGNDGEAGDRTFVIQYPATVENGGVVARAVPQPADVLTPKEEWMLAQVRRSIAAGRNTMIFGWHTVSLTRISRLIETHIGEKAPILEASKVPTKTRQAWITKEIVKKDRKVLVTNPVAVQTGLNNLIHFADVIWMENPSCNPIVYRQAIGRVDRIGQTKETNIYFPIYTGSMQESLHSLLFRKVAVSLSTDGLDAESTMAAAGIGEDSEFSTLSVGRFLYQMVQDD